jgi:hypothetical protein
MPPPLAERARRRCRPVDVRVLFIGESPPSGGTFFYFANSALYVATKEPFEAAIPLCARSCVSQEHLETRLRGEHVFARLSTHGTCSLHHGSPG